MKKFFFLLFFFSLFVFPSLSLARIGVGVGTGKIQVDEKLKPGIIYKLPDLTVLNTGDEPSEYEVSLAYHQDQPQLRPQQDWFDFSPQKFPLEPGQVKIVAIKLNLPLKMEPGDYFAYLEAQPAKKAGSGGTTIGVAAAAKLYFTVEPANFFQGLYYRLASFWRLNQPWSNRLAVAVAVIIIYLGMRKYLGFQIGFRGKKQEPSDE